MGRTMGGNMSLLVVIKCHPSSVLGHEAGNQAVSQNVALGARSRNKRDSRDSLGTPLRKKPVIITQNCQGCLGACSKKG
jgi:hypothetical protein